MVTDILNVNLTLINIMENSLLLAILILLISLTISFIIVISDYSVFKKRVERILDLNIETNNDNKEIISITEKVNNSVKQVCELNNRLIIHIHNLLEENNYLRNKLEDKEETNEE